jgi:hypothetical protein
MGHNYEMENLLTYKKQLIAKFMKMRKKDHYDDLPE